MLDDGEVERGVVDPHAAFIVAENHGRVSIAPRFSSKVAPENSPVWAGWRSAVGVIGASVFWRPAAAFQGRWNGSRGGVRLEADILGQKVGVLAQPIARPLDLDDDGMVKQPIE